MDDRSKEKRSYRRASRTLAMLALAFWAMGLVNGGRMVQSVLNVSLLANWEPSLSPWVLVVLSAGWAAAFLAVGSGLWKRRDWGRRWGVLLPPLYGLYSAGMILIFTRSPYARGRWAPVALGWMVGSVMCGWLLTRARLRALFEGRYILKNWGRRRRIMEGRSQGYAPYKFLKRLTDKGIPLIILVVAAPVLVVILVCMGLDMVLCPADRGSWFYRERRISQGKEFDLLKFRVLREEILQKAAGHVRRYEGNLANLTWAGRYVLKRWYFDELPQLLNILKGDMSLVGPRPWPIAMFREQVGRGVEYRKFIRAGWTGPAQLQKGHPNPLGSEKLDMQYLERCRTWSGWRLWRYDLGILYRTIRIMLEGQGLKY